MDMDGVFGPGGVIASRFPGYENRKEQLELAPGNRVRVWLDAQPLWSIDARLENVSYQSRQTANGVLAFTVTAKPLGAPPRIGSRGTAKVYGRWAPLGYALLRRPISSLRQYLGI